MTARKPDKSVAGMGVLKDIRGLLSASRPPQPEAPPPEPAALPEPPGPDLQAELDGLREKLRQYEADRLELQATIKGLESEKREAEAALQAYRKAPAQPAPDVLDLEARKDELSAALSQIEDLLQLKIKDLTRRIARVYEEAGDSSAGRDFRRISNQLEASENFGEFLRALLR